MKRKAEINSQLKARLESVLQRKLNSLLEVMHDRPDEVVDLESGERYICSTCDLKFKRCEAEPDYRCEMARKHETELKELELALGRLRNDTFGFCESCSNFIGLEQLEKTPTRTYCDACARKN